MTGEERVRRARCVATTVPTRCDNLPAMRIAIACDHAGFQLKQVVVAHLHDGGHDVSDLGTNSEEPVDYPKFCAAAARAVVAGDAELGIVIGGSGQGEQ